MNEKQAVIKISDWSRVPGGRFRSDGKHSAEEFRDDVLIPTMQEKPDTTIIVDLSNTVGMAASFIEEVFGGVTRKLGKMRIIEQLIVVSPEYPRYADEAADCIADVINNPEEKD